MKRKELKEFMKERISFHEQEIWAKARIDELPETYEASYRGDILQVEITFLENLDHDIHLGITVTNGGIFNCIFPVSSSFFVSKN